MAKLYFRYGTVNSAKTLNLLAVAHNYRQQGKRALIVKPALDTRWGRDWITSRAGPKMPADVVCESNTVITQQDLDNVACVLVDEAQFLSLFVIQQLADLAHGRPNIPVICYGLRTDFRTNLFPATAKLLELADTVEEVKTTCQFCDKKAIFNLKLLGGVPTLAGPSVELGAEEKYLPACAPCYYRKHSEVARSIHAAPDACAVLR
jgi:thymidine kinase